MYKQHKQVIYANPDSAYQRFVNAVKLKNPIDSDKRVTDEANKLWKELKKKFKKGFYLPLFYELLLFKCLLQV